MDVDERKLKNRTRRIWLYLEPQDAYFLDTLGAVVGFRTRNFQILYVIKTFRLLIPDPTLAPKVLAELMVEPPLHKRKRPIEGKKERTWVYISPEDEIYLRALGEMMGEKYLARVVTYLIKTFKLILPNMSAIPKIVEKYWAVEGD